jgi:hypothetical protein
MDKPGGRGETCLIGINYLPYALAVLFQLVYHLT